MRVLAISLVVLVAACADLEPFDPPQLCADLCAAACLNQAENCDIQGEDPEVFVDDCVPACEDSADCSEAENVGNTYEECIEILDEDECHDPNAGTFPDECVDVIRY